MSEKCSQQCVSAAAGGLTHRRVRDNPFIALLLVALVRTGDAMAAEQPSALQGFPLADCTPGRNDNLRPAAQPDTALSLTTYPRTMTLPDIPFALPTDYQVAPLSDREPYPAHDFRPRAHSVFEVTAQTGRLDENPMLRGTTVWQRLADYRAHGRIRILTLWEGGANTVSLQAGKKGEPSLQWTSRLLNRGGATRGLLDQLVSFSVAGAGRSFHMPSHLPGNEAAPRLSEAAPRPNKPFDAGFAGNK